MKIIIVYARKNILYISPLSRTVDGIWTSAEEPCFTIKSTDSLDEIGLLVLKALDISRENIPRPIVKGQAILDASGVKSWSAFSKTAKCIEISTAAHIIFTPTKNMGRDGFIDIEGKKIFLTLGSNTEDIGATLQKAFEHANQIITKND